MSPAIRISGAVLLACLVSFFAGHAQQSNAHSQTQCGSCSPAAWQPISGRVADAVTGAPIANALVRYSGSGNALNPVSRQPLNPPSMNGEVRTRPDGSFVLPTLVPGNFTVRVSAPGYLSAEQFLSEHPPGYRPLPPAPLSEQFCLARFGKPDCTVPPLPDGRFALQPSPIELKQMSSTAQSSFGVPGNSLLGIPVLRASAFSSDGSRLALLGIVPASVGNPGACTGWIYDLQNDRLQKIQTPLPSNFCDYGIPPRMKWDGDTVLLQWSGLDGATFETQNARWQNGIAQISAPENTTGPRSTEADGFQAKGDETVLDATNDGEYLIVSVSQDCYKCADKTSVISRGRDWSIPLENTLSGYFLDRIHDQLTAFHLGRNQQNWPTLTFNVVDLKARSRQIVPAPVFRGPPELLASQLLANGTTIIAYSMQGACDPFGPSAPFDPPAGHGAPSLARSLCIATVPKNAGEPLTAAVHQ